MSHSYKDLIVWREAKTLATTIYRATESFPKRGWYGLTAQIRRAAVSVPSNIAEGQGRLTRGEFIQFLGHARGSLLEMRTQLEIAVDLKYLGNKELEGLEARAEHAHAEWTDRFYEDATEAGRILIDATVIRFL